jgi:hypothetical protein
MAHLSALHSGVCATMLAAVHIRCVLAKRLFDHFLLSGTGRSPVRDKILLLHFKWYSLNLSDTARCTFVGGEEARNSYIFFFLA